MKFRDAFPFVALVAHLVPLDALKIIAFYAPTIFVLLYWLSVPREGRLGVLASAAFAVMNPTVGLAVWILRKKETTPMSGETLAFLVAATGVSVIVIAVGVVTGNCAKRLIDERRA